LKLGALKKQAVQNLREFARDEVRILWINDFYDGAIQRMAEVGGQRYLFDIIDRESLGREDESRAYWLIALSEDQMRDEERWHDLFCRRVGTHFDYTGRSPPSPEELCMSEFYDAYRSRPEPDYRNNDVIGWFRKAFTAPGQWP
jgi:hypothetical protein